MLIINNAIDNELLEAINSEMITAKKEGLLNYEGNDTKYLGNSYGYGNMPQSYKLLDVFDRKVLDYFGNEYIKSHVYSRIYYNGSILNKHVDREGLDITLSLCTFSDIENSWPLFIKEGSSFCPYDITVNTAVAILGTKIEHYRERLLCDEAQKVIQIFCHWKKV